MSDYGHLVSQWQDAKVEHRLLQDAAIEADRRLRRAVRKLEGVDPHGEDCKRRLKRVRRAHRARAEARGAAMRAAAMRAAGRLTDIENDLLGVVREPF